MTYEEAVEILDELGGTCSSEPEYVACHMAIEALKEKDALSETTSDTKRTVTVKLMSLDNPSKSGYIYPSNLYERLSTPNGQLDRFIFIPSETAISDRDMTKTIGYISSIDVETNSAQVLFWDKVEAYLISDEDYLVPIGTGDLIPTDEEDIYRIDNFNCCGFILH